MKIVLVTVALAAPALAAITKYVQSEHAHGVLVTDADLDVDAAWDDFKATWEKAYASPAEEAARKAIFGESVARARARNAAQVAAGGRPVFGVTKFSDHTQGEFDRRFKGYVPMKDKRRMAAPLAAHDGIAAPRDIPDSVNWLAAGAVTPVKNQGQCGSCWANSATESVESQYMLAGNAMWPLSVQQVTSCTDEVYGCGGGDTTLAYEQLASGATKTGFATAGLAPDALSPYGQSMYDECLGRACTLACDAEAIRDADVHSTGNLTEMSPQLAFAGPYVAVKGYTFATPECSAGPCADQNLTALNANTAATGPPSVCVNAAAWNDYVGGVMTSAACGGMAAADIDHCVQLVGYDLSAAEPYYLVRNSWATNWGEDGYIRLAADANTCGLANEATFATLA